MKAEPSVKQEREITQEHETVTVGQSIEKISEQTIDDSPIQAASSTASIILETPAEIEVQNTIKKPALPQKRPKKSICPICGHAVDGKKKLERHLRVHAPSYNGHRPVRVKTNENSIEDSPIQAASSTASIILDTPAEVDVKITIKKPALTQKRPKNSICPICGHAVDGKLKLERHLRVHAPGYNANRPVGVKTNENPEVSV
jgi:ribosomal protein L34E